MRIVSWREVRKRAGLPSPRDLALIIHTEQWEQMHAIYVEKGSDCPEYRGARATMLRAWERVKETSR